MRRSHDAECYLCRRAVLLNTSSNYNCCCWGTAVIRGLSFDHGKAQGR